MLKLIRRIGRRIERRLPTTLRVGLWKQSQRLLGFRYQARNRTSILSLVAIPLASVIAALATDAAVADVLKPGLLGDVLIGTATLIGGFLTSAFAISVSLQQSVADLYSPQHLSGYVFGIRQRIAFGSIALLILLCLSFGIYTKTLIPIEEFEWIRVIGLLLGFLAIGTSLGVLGWQLQYGGEALRPVAAIGFLRNRAFRHLKVLQENAIRLAVANSLLYAHQPGRLAPYGPHVSVRRQRLAQAYAQLGESPGRVLSAQLAPFIDIGIRLSDRADAIGAGQAISAWAEVFNRYLLLRRHTSTANASQSVFGAIEPDNSAALHRAFEQFNDLGIRALKNRQAENTRLIVRVYGGLITSAFRVGYVNRQHENPIAEVAAGYLSNLVQFALADGDYEVAFAAIPVFEQYGVGAIDYGISHAGHSVCKFLDEIVPFSFKPSFEILAKPCTNAFRSLLWAYLFKDAPLGNTARVLESVERYHALSGPYYASNRGGGVPSSAFVAVRAPFEDLQTIVEQFSSHYKNSDEPSRKQYRRAFIEFASHAHGFVRSVVEVLASRDGYADVLPSLIVSTASVLSELREQFSVQTSSESASGWIYLLTWTGHKLKVVDSDTMSTAAEFAADAALTGIQLGDDDMRDAAIKTHGSIVRRQLKAPSAGLGYDEPRAIARMGLVAAYALKTKKWALLHRLVIEIQLLEEKYDDYWKASGLRPTTVGREFEKLWEFGVGGPPMFRESPSSNAGRVIDRNDMDHLAWLVWGQVRRHSRFESELPQRKEWGQRLVDLLSARTMPQPTKAAEGYDVSASGRQPDRYV